MEKKITRKLHTEKGFTLAETLIAILILLMVSMVVAVGIPAVRNAYEKVVQTSNAEVFLSTAISMLRNELGTAQDVETPTANTITYYNPTRGAPSKLYVDSENHIMFQRYYDADGLMKEGDAPAPLLSSGENMYVTYTSVSYAGGIVTFSDLSVKKGTETLTDEVDYSIRVISGS